MELVSVGSHSVLFLLNFLLLDMYCYIDQQVSGTVSFISSVFCILSYLKINKRSWKDGSVVKILAVGLEFRFPRTHINVG